MADLVTEELFEASDEDMIDEEEAFDAIMERLLSRVPTTLDTREGSVIYNALAPAAWEIQLLYEELQTVLVEASAPEIPVSKHLVLPHCLLSYFPQMHCLQCCRPPAMP